MDGVVVDGEHINADVYLDIGCLHKSEDPIWEKLLNVLQKNNIAMDLIA